MTTQITVSNEWAQVSQAGSTVDDDFIMQNNSEAVIGLSFSSSEPSDDAMHLLYEGDTFIRAGVSGKVWVKVARQSTKATGAVVISGA